MLSREMRRRLRNVAGPLLGLTLLVYFAYHMVQGDRGLLAWWRLNREIHTAEATLADLQTQQQALQHRADLLRPDHLDPDMLEERARLMLDLGRPDDLVVLRPKS